MTNKMINIGNTNSQVRSLRTDNVRRIPGQAPQLLRLFKSGLKSGKYPDSNQDMDKRLLNILRNLGPRERINVEQGSDKFERHVVLLVASLRLAFKQDQFILTNPNDAKAWEGLMRMFGFLIKCSTQGQTTASAVLKQWTAECQAISVGKTLDAKPDIPRLDTFLLGSLKSSLTRKSAWHFAGLGRSIPPPKSSEKQVSREVKSWIETLTLSDQHREPIELIEGFRHVDELESDLKRYCERMFRRARNSHPEKGRLMGSLRLNTSASLESSRSKGGVYAHYMDRTAKEKGGTFHIPKGTYEHPQMPLLTGKDLQLDDRRKLMLTTGIAHYSVLNRINGLDDPKFPKESPHLVSASSQMVANYLIEKDIQTILETDGYIPQCKPLLLPERGNKFRIATISSAPLVVAGQRINAVLLKLLKTFQVTAYSLRGDKGIPKPLRAAVAAYGGDAIGQDCEFISTDLSKASDFIPHKVALMVWEGIWSAIKDELPPSYKEVGKLLLGPMEVIADDDVTVKALRGYPRITTRGILMGLPLTWTVLSVLNMYAAHRAMLDMEQIDKSFRTLNRRMNKKSLLPYIICGDDMAAYWPEKVSVLYMNHLHATCGLKVNKRKTFRSPTGCIFVERCFELDPKVYYRKATEVEPTKKHPYNLTLWDVIMPDVLRRKGRVEIPYRKLRQIVRPQLSALSLAKKNDNGSQDDVKPDWMILPDVYKEQYGRADTRWRKERVMELLRLLHPSTVKMMEASGIPLAWPRELGGYGFPGRNTAPTFYKKAAAVLLTMQPRQFKIEISKLTSMWTTVALPPKQRKQLGRILTQIESQELLQSEEVNGSLIEYQTRSELYSDVIGRVMNHNAISATDAAVVNGPGLGKMGLLKKPKPSLDRLGATIRKAVRAISERWGSANPITSEKLELLLDKIVKDHNSELLPTKYVDSILYYNHVPDKYLLDVTVNQLTPEERLSLYKGTADAQQRSTMAGSGLPPLLYEVAVRRNSPILRRAQLMSSVEGNDYFMGHPRQPQQITPAVALNTAGGRRRDRPRRNRTRRANTKPVRTRTLRRNQRCLTE